MSLETERMNVIAKASLIPVDDFHKERMVFLNAEIDVYYIFRNGKLDLFNTYVFMKDSSLDISVSVLSDDAFDYIIKQLEGDGVFCD